MSCYELEVLEFERAVLSLPISYLITMTTSTRRSRYMAELSKSPPTRTVVVVHNTGYLQCGKGCVDKPCKDLWHANQFIAQHHLSTQPTSTHVLIMEDDVQFSDRFSQMGVFIDDALVRLQPDVYSISSLPVWTLPFDAHHLKGSFAMTSAVIYSNKILARFGEVPACSLKWGHDTFEFWWRLMPYRSLMLREPLAGQLMEDTANKAEWDSTGVFSAINSVFDARNDPLWLVKFQAIPIVSSFGSCGTLTGLALLTVVVLVYLRHHRRSASP